MAKQADLPRDVDFYKPTLEVLMVLGGSGSIEEIEDAIITHLGISQSALDATTPKTDTPILRNRMAWARSYLKFAGLLSNPQRGVWVLTEEGREAVHWTDAKIRRAVADAYNASEAKRRVKRASLTEPNDEVSSIETAGEEPGWQDQLLQRLQTVEPAAFERLSQRMLRQSGFTKVEVIGKSGDGGIDGVGVLRVNLISFQVLFQCKRWKGSVGASVVRDFRGAMQGRADKGLIITTGTFTTDARLEATRDGAPAIDLIDGEYLCILLKNLGLGVTVRKVTVEEISIDEEFFDAI